ncbi:MAG: PorT family protein [Bacteroidetes bacterium]|nr:PorT family protein [Bacteroidota bacterium]MBS1930053.1 PorT family protein [Bacteroidota bacterium]
MRKTFFCLLVSGIFIIRVHAQFGVNGGLNISNVRGDVVQNSKSKPGLHLGVFYKIPLPAGIAIQVEAAYSGEGAKTVITGSQWKYNFDYLNLAALFRYDFEGGFNVATGFQYGILLSAKLKSTGNTVDYKNGVRNVNYSWAFAAGYDLPLGVGFYGRYNLGMSDIAKDSQGGSMKASTFQVGVRYNIHLSKEKK